MSAPASLDVCRAARVPRAGLAMLAPLRRMTNVRIVELGDEAWVSWDGDMPSIVGALMSIKGARLYRQCAEGWQPLNDSLPDFTAPTRHESLPLDRAVVPMPCTPIELEKFEGKRIPISLVASHKPRPTSALRCDRSELADWCARATTAEIEAVLGAWNGSTVWLRGRLPALSNAQRFWGQRVLVPLGYCPEPDWPESALLEAAIVDDDEILVLSMSGPEAIPGRSFQKLSRASIRRLLQTVSR